MGFKPKEWLVFAYREHWQKFGSLLIIGLFLPVLVSCFGGSLEERLPCWLHFYFSSVSCPVPNGTVDLPFQNNALPKKGRRRKNSCCLFFIRRILLCNLLHTSGSCIPLLPISKTIFLFSPPANAHLVICQVVPSVKNVVNIFLPRPLVIHAHLHLPTC